MLRLFFALLVLLATLGTTSAFAASGPQPPPSPTPTVEPFYYRKLIADTHLWRKTEPLDECIDNIKQFQCTYSPWRTLSLRERYEEILSIVNTRPMSGNLRALESAIPCLMMRETGILEPLTVSFKNCDVNAPPATDQGLGQVTFNTFCSLLGLTEEETEQALEGRKLSLDRARQLNVLTHVAPYNSLTYRMNPLMAFQAMSDNVDYAIDVSLAVLKSKLARTQEVYDIGSNAGARFDFDAQYFTIENYNGSDRKQDYAKAIMACKTCMDSNPADPDHCLGLAIGKQDVEDFLPCESKL